MKSVQIPFPQEKTQPTKVIFVIEVQLKSQKTVICHESDTRGSYDNPHFYIVYVDKRRINGANMYMQIHRYPVHAIEKVTETILEVPNSYELNYLSTKT